MRFINVIIWLGIITTLFSGALYSLIYLDLPFGQGDPISNISYYLLSQDPNNILTTDDKYRYITAKKFLLIGASPLLIYLTISCIIVSVLWVIIGEFLKIDRPNKAFKYLLLWFIFLFILLALVGGMTFYMLYLQNEIWHVAELSRLITLIICMLIYVAIFFYLVSMFITSRVLRPAVPFLTIILRN
ncbi:hypothetical protein N8761_00840 [Alphaproteobacteria bacterium]|nr:hypothetical protein [Alphaproteobacteria bacterium]